MAEPKNYLPNHAPEPEDLLLPPLNMTNTVVNQTTPAGIPEYLESEIDQRRMQQEAKIFADKLRLETEARQLIYDKQYRDVGRFIITRTNNYLSNKWAVELPQHHLGFDSDAYPLFDHEVSKAFHVDALKNEQHLDHDDYKGLRKNIAIVRNVVYRQMFPDGEFNENDPKDAEKKEVIANIGATLGKILKRGRQGWLPSAGPAISLADASEEDIGAARLYSALHSAQKSRLPLLLSMFNGLVGAPKMAWGLKPIEQTALSRKSMEEYWNCTKLDRDIVGHTGSRPSELIEQKSNVLETIANNIANLAKHRRPEEMPPAQQIMSIELAEKILKNFRIHLDAAKQVVGPDIPTEIFQYSEYLSKLSVLYLNNITLMTQHNPALLENAEFMRQAEAASTTIGKMAHILEIKAQRFYAEEGDSKKVDEITRRIMEPGNEKWERVSQDNLALLGEDLVQHVRDLNHIMLMQQQQHGLPNVSQALAAAALKQQAQTDVSLDYQLQHQKNVAQKALETAAGLKNTWSSAELAQAPKAHLDTIKQMNQPQKSVSDVAVEEPTLPTQRLR